MRYYKFRSYYYDKFDINRLDNWTTLRQGSCALSLFYHRWSNKKIDIFDSPLEKIGLDCRLWPTFKLGGVVSSALWYRCRTGPSSWPGIGRRRPVQSFHMIFYNCKPKGKDEMPIGIQPNKWALTWTTAILIAAASLHRSHKERERSSQIKKDADQGV